MLRARTLASIVRTVVSTSLALLLFKARLGKGLEAVLWGGALADYADVADPKPDAPAAGPLPRPL